MNAADARRFFDSLGPSVIKLGLERIREALHALGDPQLKYPTLHVAGTNGKGSACAFLDSILRAQGYKAGLYTSPHLERVNERIRVGGVEISDELFAQRILEVLDRYPKMLESPPPLTYFEFGTLVAFWHFAQEDVDYAVLETGLGGRLDATTACAPEVTAITSISFDHKDMLGDTLGKIAREKAGIFKRDVPAVTCAQPQEALDALAAVAAEVAAPLWVEDRDFSLEGDTYRGPTWRLPALKWSLSGSHQRQNVAVALAALEASGVLVTEGAIRSGLLTARWPGRLELFGGSPEILLDGAHNPAGIAALCEELDRRARPGRRLRLVFGVLADKDWKDMVPPLFAKANAVHLTPLPSPRTLDPSAYAEFARAHCREVHVHASAAEALQAARLAAAPDDLVLVAGSLVLIGTVRSHLNAQQATRRES